MTTAEIATITPLRLEALHRSGHSIDLIDVRTPAEFREAHVEIARNVPLDLLRPEAVMETRNGNGEEPLYVTCRSGGRSANACAMFVAAGFTNVVNVEGGMLAWEEAGLHVVRGKKAIALERQVRIAAGLLALVGGLLALAVDPWFALLPAAVGAGLMHAGITDSCAMGMLLGRMPWNRAGCQATGAGECRL